jgi:hypothetical protein
LLKRVILIVEAVGDPHIPFMHFIRVIRWACLASRLLGLSGGFSASRLLVAFLSPFYPCIENATKNICSMVN